ncbi:AEP3 (YPL005W) [Zygosaccharomyces parabailii]|nr:AEP3 (YPL005W) [Zygosaccharomyces parabailii]
MNVLKRLGEILTKDGIKKGELLREEVFPVLFESNRSPAPIARNKQKMVKAKACEVANTTTKNVAKKPSKEVPNELPKGSAKELSDEISGEVSTKRLKKLPKKLPKKLSNNLSIKENIRYVGEGSKLGKKVAREYLSPLQGHSISRLNILDDYDTEKAMRVYGQVKHIKQSPKLQDMLLTKFLKFTGEMLAALIACSSSSVKINSQHLKKTYLRYSTQKVPRIPKFENNSRTFEDYIGLLSHTKFLYKNSSSTNGIVPKILRNLMHPANIKTLHLRTTSCYNDLIYYFSEKFDFATCRELFVQMKLENVPPNTVTYNLLLRSVLKNSHIRKTKFFDEEVLYYLRNMKRRGIEADSVTWTTCYNLLGDDVSRLLFVEQMHENGVPITGDFVYTVLRNGDYTSNECLKFLTNYKVPLDSKSFKLCMARLLTEGRVDVAWVFMDYTWNNSQTDLRIGVDVLNQFLRTFAAQGRLDLSFMAFNTYVKERRVKPDAHTFEMLFKAFVRNGYHRNFVVVLTYLQNLRKEYGFENRDNYWLVKARSMAKFNIDPGLGAVTPAKLQRLSQLMDALKWGADTMTFSTRLWESHGTQFKNACRMIGCIPMAFRRRNTGSENISASQRKEEYRKRIRYIALQNAMIKRIPYAKDWYGTLRRDLEEGGLSSK